MPGSGTEHDKSAKPAPTHSNYPRPRHQHAPCRYSGWYSGTSELAERAAVPSAYPVRQGPPHYNAGQRQRRDDPPLCASPCRRHQSAATTACPSLYLSPADGYRDRTARRQFVRRYRHAVTDGGRYSSQQVHDHNTD